MEQMTKMDEQMDKGTRNARIVKANSSNEGRYIFHHRQNLAKTDAFIG